MDQKWAQSDPSDKHYDTRFASSVPPPTYNQPQQTPTNGSFQPSISSQAASLSLNSVNSSTNQSHNMAFLRDHEGDVSMEDPQEADPYNKQKYEDLPRDPSVRPAHRHRPSSQYNPQDQSAAAQRYSPMALSPSSPYAATPHNPPATQYSPYSPSRQSPSRPSMYSSNSQSYYSSGNYQTPGIFPTCQPMLIQTGSRAQSTKLPPLEPTLSPQSSGFFSPRSATQQSNASFSREPASSANSHLQHSPLPRPQVPRLARCMRTSELNPKVNTQPPYRRAHPDGGFISVCFPK